MPNPDLPGTSPSQGPATPGFVLDLQFAQRLVTEYWWVVVSCTISFLVAAFVYVHLAPRIFESVTTVQVEQEDAKVVTGEQVVNEDLRGLDTLNTIVEKLANPDLLQTVLETNSLLQPEETTQVREEAVKKLARNVKISLRRDTRLIDIAVRNNDPLLAARLANSLVEEYLAKDALDQQTTMEGANAFLRQEAERQQKKLETSEQKLEDYRKQIGSVSLDQSQDIITPQLKALSELLTQTNANVIQARGAYQDSLKMSTNIEDLLAYTRVATDPDVVQISTEVSRHENDFVLISQRYREKNPKYIVAAASLAGLRQQLAQTVLTVRARIQENLRIAYEDALTSQQGLESELQATETNAMQLSDVAVRFNVLSLEVESDKAQFDSIINRLGQTTVAGQITPERLQVIQPAMIPLQPVSPRTKIIFALALFGGLAAGLAISFAIDSMNTSVRTIEESELYLALPVLGAIPRLPKIKINGNKLVSTENGDSAVAEVFRTMRTTLGMLGREEDRKIFLFTSALPGEGKTFTAANYAASLAQQGLRTLLIDMDLRRPMLEQLFTGKRGSLPGVTDYFLGRKKFSELCLPHGEVSKLFWIPGGSNVPNPLELLMQSDFKQLINEGLAQFDRIIIDAVPLLPVSDSLIMVGKVQTVIMVVHSGKTPRLAVQRGLQMLKQANAPVGGVVLNLLPNRLFKGHYYLSSYR